MSKPKNHSEVCHQWASQEIEEGSCGNISFRNGEILSYHWWPMAKFMTGVDGSKYIIMVGWSYSSSTSKHLNYVRRAIPQNIPVYLSSERGYSYSGRGTTDLSNMGVLKAMLKNIEAGYNAFMKEKSHLYLDTDHQVLSNRTTYREAVDFCVLTGIKWIQDFDKYLLSESEITIMRRFVAPAVARQAEQKRIKEEKALLIQEANNRLQLRYCPDPVSFAKDWIMDKVAEHEGRYGYYNAIELPIDDPDVVFTGTKKLYPDMATAMRIEGDHVVTNRSARVPVESAKRLWNIMKSGRPIAGEKVGIYSAVKWNGELVVGCHHISREIVEFFVEHYGWNN